MGNLVSGEANDQERDEYAKDEKPQKGEGEWPNNGFFFEGFLAIPRHEEGLVDGVAWVIFSVKEKEETSLCDVVKGWGFWG